MSSAKKKPAAKRKRKGRPTDPVVMETPKHGGGKLKRGGNWGNKGGRPPNELRQRIRDLGYIALEETIRRVEASVHKVPSRAQLEKLKKEELVDMLAEIGEWVQLKPGEIRSILDTAFKYGVGTKHVVGGDEDAAPLTVRVIRS